MTGIVIPDGGTIGSASDTDALTITNTGVVKASQSIATSTIKDATGTNNSISIATNGEATFAENIILTANKGLSFQNHSVSNATGASSTTSDNVLDDYEEGTWTPTNGGGITSASGRYVKIGQLVLITATVTNDNDGSTANNFGGLPFNCKNVTVPGYGATARSDIDATTRGIRFIGNTDTFQIRGGNDVLNLTGTQNVQFGGIYITP